MSEEKISEIRYVNVRASNMSQKMLQQPAMSMSQIPAKSSIKMCSNCAASTTSLPQRHERLNDGSSTRGRGVVGVAEARARRCSNGGVDVDAAELILTWTGSKIV